MYVYVCFDVEDLVHPDSDDVPRDIADLLADVGVVGSMCVVAEKARLWEMRGRRDVIAAVAKHDVGLHTNRHSMHPTVSEYLADTGWEDGVAEAVRRERPGADDITRIFGSYPSTWGTSGSSWGPQIPAATRRFGVPSHIYAHVSLGNAGAWWFAGQLCYPNGVSLRGGEDAYCDQSLFEQRLPRLVREVEDLARSGTPCVLLFGGHPTRFLYTQFWDAINFAQGNNPDPKDYQPSPRRAAEACATGIRNLVQMVRSVRDLPGVELISVRGLNGRFAPESGPVDRSELIRLASSAADGDIRVDDPAASPAQALDLLCRALTRRSESAQPPNSMLSRTVLGPVETRPPLDQPVAVPAEQVASICRSVVAWVDRTGHLPPAVSVNGKDVGPGPLLIGLARCYLDVAGSDQAPDLELSPGPEEPNIAPRLAEEQIYRSLPGWPPHRPGLRLDRLATHLKLQTWSLKPAVLAAG